MAESNLIPGEAFSLKDNNKVSPDRLSDQEINEKYRRGEIRIVTEQARYPLDNIEAMLDSNKYNRNPEYQRRKRWNNIRKSRLIESFIMNVPIPPIFLYEVNYSEYEVMDGLQRLTAIYDFYKGSYSLEGLEYWQDLNGRKYNDLPDQIRKGIDRRYLSSVVLLQETAKNSEEAEYLKQIVFERLNSGGEKLTPQETRNALHNGKFNQLCIELAENDSFRKMWKLPLISTGEEELLKSEPHRKMEDVELVLRFFAYRHIHQFRGATVEKFLDEYLKFANNYSLSVQSELKQLFIETIDIIYNILGESAFLLPTRDQNYKSPSKTIYDPIMQAFAFFRSNGSQLKLNASQIKNSLYTDQKLLIRNDKRTNTYLFDGRYSNSGDVQVRIKYFEDILKNFI